MEWTIGCENGIRNVLKAFDIGKNGKVLHFHHVTLKTIDIELLLP